MTRVTNQQLISFFCLLIGLVLLVGTVPVPAQGAREFKDFPAMSQGDKFSYKVNADNLGDAIGRSFAEDDFIGAEEEDLPQIELKLTGEETVNVGGTDYQCIILESTWSLSFTFILKAGSDYDDDRISFEMTMVTTSWTKEFTQTTMKSESTSETHLRFAQDGESYHFEFVEEEREDYTSVDGEDFVFPLKVGNSWSMSSTYLYNSSSKSRVNEGDWDHDYFEDDMMGNTTQWEVLSENDVTVNPGSFQCLKLKRQVQGSSSYSEEFYDMNGIPVKNVNYDEDGTISVSFELESYSMKNERKPGSGDSDDDDDFEIMGMNGYYLIGGLVTLVIIAGVFAVLAESGRLPMPGQGGKKKKSRGKEPSLCPNCRGTMEFQEEYRKWYCWDCGEYNHPIAPKKKTSSRSRKNAGRRPAPRRGRGSSRSRGSSRGPAPGRRQQGIKSPKCKACHNPMEYLDEFQRWYCWECERYAAADAPSPEELAARMGQQKRAAPKKHAKGGGGKKTRFDCPGCGRAMKIPTKRPLKFKCKDCGELNVLRK